MHLYTCGGRAPAHHPGLSARSAARPAQGRKARRAQRRRGSLLMAAALAGGVCPAQHALGQVRGNAAETLPLLRDNQVPELRSEIQIKPRSNPVDAVMAAKVTPQRFTIEGVKAIPFEEVAAKFAPLAGTTLTVGDLVKVSEEITAMYQKAGYALSFAFIPTQDFAGGVVRVTAVEGHVTKVTVDGDLGNMEPKVRAIAARIMAEKPLKRETFERYVNILGTLPGLTVSASVPPPPNTDGATELTLKATRKQFAVDNGMDFNHPGVQNVTTGMINGITPLADQLTVAAVALPGKYKTQYFAAGYTVPVGSDGASTKIEAYTYRTNPADMVVNGMALRRDIDTQRVALTLSYPLRFTNSERIVISGGPYANNYSDRYTSRDTGSSVALKTEVRAVYGEIAYTAAATGRTRQAGAAIYQGINGLGAGQSNTSTDLGFTRVRGRFAQTDEWAGKISTTLSTVVQYSGNRLPSSEQVSFGGLQFGRGYPAGEVAGDSGWGVSLDAARPLPVSWGMVKVLTPYLVADSAQVYRNGMGYYHAKLASVGGGLRISDGKHNSLDLSLAMPVGERPTSGSRAWRPNLLYSLQF